jgi:hypothetical protein
VHIILALDLFELELDELAAGVSESPVNFSATLSLPPEKPFCLMISAVEG